MNSYRYSLVQFIAAGGFAKVYRGVDNWTQRTVAIKQLSNPTPESLCRFRRERDMLTIHRDNPFVVEILDSSLDGPEPYLVLEYSSLGSLQKYVTERRDWRRIAGWLFDIAYGLFCQLVGYQREELVGKRYDDLTAPNTNDVPTVFGLFQKLGYMHGMWMLVSREGTRILVRYESWLRPDSYIEGHMEVVGAGY